jgi:hypothetical protein
MRIGVVGVCGAGKSALVARLRGAGFDAHEIAQEHSYVPDMWQRIHPPDVLIYLEASFETITQRRPNSLMTQTLYEQMLQRLRHAREHAGIVICQDHKGEDESFVEAASYLTLLRA